MQRTGADSSVPRTGKPGGRWRRVLKGALKQALPALSTARRLIDEVQRMPVENSKGELEGELKSRLDHLKDELEGLLHGGLGKLQRDQLQVNTKGVLQAPLFAAYYLLLPSSFLRWRSQRERQRERLEEILVNETQRALLAVCLLLQLLSPLLKEEAHWWLQKGVRLEQVLFVATHALLPFFLLNQDACLR